VKLLVPLMLLSRAAFADELQAVGKAMEAAQPGLHRCWEKAAADDWRVSGVMQLELTLGMGGRVTGVKVTADSTNEPSLAPCVSQVWKQQTIGDPFTAGMRVELPVEFQAEAPPTVRVADVAPILSGTIQVRILLDERAVDSDGKADLILFSFPAGAESALHRHSTPELLFVCEGTVDLLGVTLTKGDAAFLPAGAPHRAKVVGGPAKLLNLYAPAGVARPVRFPTMKNTWTSLVTEPELKQPGVLRPRISLGSQAKTYPIANGGGAVKMLVEDGSIYAGELSLTSGVAVPEHVHATEAEVLFVLAGGGELTIDGRPYPVETGTAVYIPAGAKHSFKAAGSFRAVQFYAPGGPAQRFKGKP
jgi:quercetin dioxygenase-like cupin family protein